METPRIPTLEAAIRLGVSVETVRQLAQQEAIAAQHRDGDYWFLPEDVEAYAGRQAFADAPGDGTVTRLVQTAEAAPASPPPPPAPAAGASEVRVPLTAAAGNRFHPGDTVTISRSGGRWLVEGGLIHNVQESTTVVTIFADAPPGNERPVIT